MSAPPPEIETSTVLPLKMILLPVPTKFSVLTVPIAVPADCIATIESESSMDTLPVRP